MITKYNTDFNYFKKINPEGDFEKKYGIAGIIDTLTNVLSTKKGSYPGDPEFGSLLHTFLFDELDEFTQMDIEQEIRYIAEVYASKAKLINLSVSKLKDNKGFYAVATLKYKNKTKSLEISNGSGSLLVSPK